ncbi:hypothetical protein [Terribacillus saccharophilus]|uniref:hypothetical protein n=1 Tax=Terribacillus saccharophilus TaxID=361277 RepID=UPI003981C9DE
MLQLGEYSKNLLKYEMDNRRKNEDDLISPDVYMISKTIPARLENGIVINFLKYQQLTKKLKNFQVEMKLHHNKLVILYSQKGTRGCFELYDMQHHYKGFIGIPNAVKERETCQV